MPLCRNNNFSFAIENIYNFIKYSTIFLFWWNQDNDHQITTIIITLTAINKCIIFTTRNFQPDSQSPSDLKIASCDALAHLSTAAPCDLLIRVDLLRRLYPHLSNHEPLPVRAAIVRLLLLIFNAVPILARLAIQEGYLIQWAIIFSRNLQELVCLRAGNQNMFFRGNWVGD